MAEENYTEALTQLALIIKQNPTTAYFLVQQVRCFLGIELYEYAQRIAKVTINFCVDSFEPWFLYAKACLGTGDLREALIAVDQSPLHPDLQLMTIPMRLSNNLQIPFTQSNTDCFSSFMIPNVMFMDFNLDSEDLFQFFLTGQSPTPNIFGYTKSELGSLRELYESNKRTLVQTRSQSLLFELLVSAQSEYGLKRLIQEIQATFLQQDQCEQFENPFLELQSNQKAPEPESSSLQSPRSFTPTVAVPQGIYQESKMLGSGKNQNLNLSAIKEKSAFVAIFPTVGEGLGKPDSRMSVEDLFTEKKVAPARPEIQPPNFENSSKKQQSQQELRQRKKRSESKILKMMQLVFGDLQLINTWMQIEQATATEKHRCGYLWLNRAVLSQKLQRTHLAERAYRNVVEQGFSLFAWTQLLKIYTKVQNTKSILISVSEILQQLESRGLLELSYLPPWIDEALAVAIQSRGLQYALQKMRESQINTDNALMNALKLVLAREPEGFDF